MCVAPFGVVSSSREKIFYRLGMVCDSRTHSNIKASRAPVDVSQGWNQHGGVACCCVRLGGREIEACYFYSIANICSARVAFLGVSWVLRAFVLCFVFCLESSRFRPVRMVLEGGKQLLFHLLPWRGFVMKFMVFLSNKSC